MTRISFVLVLSFLVGCGPTVVYPDRYGFYVVDVGQVELEFNPNEVDQDQSVIYARSYYADLVLLELYLDEDEIWDPWLWPWDEFNDEVATREFQVCDRFYAKVYEVELSYDGKELKILDVLASKSIMLMAEDCPPP